ncbi:MAG: hypothetical protein AAGA42_00720 [Actinomycetota bacterium]
MTASATSVSATAETVDYRVVAKQSLLLNPPVDDHQATDVFQPLGAGTADRVEFDGTNGNIKCRTPNRCELSVMHRAGLGNPWFTFLELDVDQLDFTVDAAGNVVDADVDGFYTVRYENWGAGVQIPIHRPLTSVTGAYVDDELRLTFGSTHSPGAAETTVAELVFEVAPPPSGGGGPATPPLEGTGRR